jgi:hypothetical protein
MKNALAEEIFALIEAWSPVRPTPMEFEMAYQARVAMDRIRFAIKHTEQFGPQTEPMREAGFQLLDALQRLEMVDRRFQTRCRLDPGSNAGSDHSSGGTHDEGETGSLQRANGRHVRQANYPESSD